MIPAELRRRRRGCRAGAKLRSRGRKMRPSVPSIITGTVRCLGDKMDDLRTVENRESSILCFTETWLHVDHSASISGFRTIRTGGDVTWEGLQFLWVTGGAALRSLNFKDVSMRPYYLPQGSLLRSSDPFHVPLSADESPNPKKLWGSSFQISPGPLIPTICRVPLRMGLSVCCLLDRCLAVG